VSLAGDAVSVTVQLARVPRFTPVDRGGPSGDQRRALADVFWALLNSGEFLLNH